jgi:magnesium transporter
VAFFTKRYHPMGTPPGTLVETPVEETTPPRLRLIDYSSDAITVIEDTDVAHCRSFLDQHSVTWVHVQGTPPVQTMRELGEHFDLHALALEDVLNTGQRPKLETFDDQLFIVMSLPLLTDDMVEVHQVSLFLGENFLISICAGDFTPFQSIVTRLQDRGSRLRTQNADFLLYSLLDIVIDQGFPVLEDFGLQLEALEESILSSIGHDTPEKIHILKRELILLRRMLWPQREVLNQLLRDDHVLITPNTLIYLRDCYDHTVQVMELLETYRDMTASMLDIYLSSISHRTNEVMRLLTLIATIFIPLTFIVGVYGMNFDPAAGPLSMPELSWRYGYVGVWGLMIALAAGMLWQFRKRKWL